MRKYLLALAALLAILPMSAKQIGIDEAKELVNKFVRENSRLKSLASGGDITLAYTAATNTVANYYVYNLAQGGFVIVSADDCVEQVLGYSENGSFDINTVPENMLSMLEGYKQEINYAITHSVTGGMPAVLAAPETATADRQPVSPLLTSKWNQNSPYNDLCPMYDSTRRCVTGCTATATAQIMNYFEWPKTGKGSCSYSCNINGTATTLSLDFSTIDFDWDNMLDVYGTGATDEQKEAVATLMYSVGVGAKMSYGLSSGAYLSDAYRALIGNFDYDKSLKYAERMFYSINEWNDLIYNEVSNGRPVLYAGYNSSAGHAFVCDGYSSDNFFHFNWGWGGTSDGYFKLSALDPMSQGIGGSDSGYNSNQEIVYGFAPNKGTEEAFYSLGYDGDFKCDATEIAAADVANTTISFSTGEIFSQFSLYSKSCILNLGIDVVNNTTNDVVNILGSSLSVQSNSSYYYSGFSLSASEFANLADGVYTIYPTYDNTTLGRKGNVTIPYGKQKTIQLTVSNGKLTFANTHDGGKLVISNLNSAANFYSEKPFLVSFDVENQGSDFKDNLYLGILNANDELLQVEEIEAEVDSGETVTCEIGGIMGAYDAGDYVLYIMRVVDGYYTPIVGAKITIAANPGDYELSHTGCTFPDKMNIYCNDFQASFAVTNAGGLFVAPLYCAIYNGTTGANVAIIESGTVFIDKGRTVTVSFKGSFDGVAGKSYSAYLFAYDDGWKQVGSGTRFIVKGVSGIEDVEADATQVAVYPNPASDVVNVESPSAITDIAVFAPNGQQVIAADAAGSQRTSVQVDNLPAGVYVMKINTADGVVMHRLIKK